MTSTDITSRALHDVGLAVWFGGILANAVVVNAAAGEVDDPRNADAVANAGWDRWTPVNAGAIGAHLIGSVAQLLGNLDRIRAQQGVSAIAFAIPGLTAALVVLSSFAGEQQRPAAVLSGLRRRVAA